MSSLSIGDFSRATHLSVKTLRYYHEAGLLPPAEIDPNSGYRRYDDGQIPTAQIIRRLRDLEMPVADVREVLRADDVATRNALIARHLARLETELARTQSAVAQLRDLLDHPSVEAGIEHRSLPAMRVAAITAEVSTSDLGDWLQGALGELHAGAAAQRLADTGVPGGIYANGLFEDGFGSATVYLPTSSEPRAVGRLAAHDLPAVELAVITHAGPEDGIDRAYGTLGAYVSRHALAVDGPIRELYAVDRWDTPDSSRWRTEIGWPIFATAAR